MSGEDCKDHGSKDHGKKNLIDAEAHRRLCKHIEREGERRKDAVLGISGIIHRQYTREAQQVWALDRNTSMAAQQRIENACPLGSILCEIHVDRSRHHSIIPSITSITPVSRCPSLDIIDHASKQPDLSPSRLPPRA